MTDSRQVQMHKKRNNEQRKSTIQVFCVHLLQLPRHLVGKEIAAQIKKHEKPVRNSENMILSCINDKNIYYLSFISDKMIIFTPEKTLLS